VRSNDRQIGEDSILALPGAEHDRLCPDRAALAAHRGGEQEILALFQKELTFGLYVTFVAAPPSV
jgi:hypothetical protein